MIRAAGFYFLALLVAATLLAVPSLARAAMSPGLDGKLGGQVRATLDGRSIAFPLLKSEIDVDIQGDLATVTVIQTFTNPADRPLNATYLFPLNRKAAVFAMQMEVGDERVIAKIKRREEAKAEFEKAKTLGKVAALLSQHRPNMFTQEIANLMPGQPVRVTLQYVQTVPRVDGAYELVVPLIVGPRYNPQRPAGMAKRAPADADSPQPVSDAAGWQVAPPPAYPEVAGLTIPATVDSDRVSIRVGLDSGVPVSEVISETHELAVSGGETAKEIRLAAGTTIDNRDFILRYRLAAGGVQAGLLTHMGADGGTFSLMIEPPEAPLDADITARELVFVLDTSGSMSGEPIEASKTFMRHALQTLRPTDYFRILRFSNNSSEFATGPVSATPEAVAHGIRFVDALQAGGGTEIPNAIRSAFAVRQQPDTMRIVVFLSDGYIGNEAEVLGLIDDVLNDARIYAFGVGSSVNRYLLAEMARHGRGFARFIDPTESSHDAAISLADRIDAPVLTDISVDWGSLDASEVAPRAIPDLFKGDSIRIQGRYETGGEHELTIRGRVNGRPAQLPLKAVFAAEPRGEAGRAIPLVWARTQIADAMAGFVSPRRAAAMGLSADQLQEKVTRLGLSHSLVTRWTSFIAVSEKVANPDPALAADKSVPLPMVKGVGPAAYPKQAALPANTPMGGNQFAGNFSGGAAPEPESMLALLVMMLAGLFGLRRRLGIGGLYGKAESWR
jgi:Ca-activated chloride channel family protein